MNFIFCKLKKPQKTWISFFASLKNFKKTWISFFASLKKLKHEFHFLLAKRIRRAETSLERLERRLQSYMATAIAMFFSSPRKPRSFLSGLPEMRPCPTSSAEKQLKVSIAWIAMHPMFCNFISQHEINFLQAEKTSKNMTFISCKLK